MSLSDQHNHVSSDHIGGDDNSVRLRAFAEARRHSRRVRFYRLALPVLTIFLSVTIFASAGLLNGNKMGFSIEAVSIGEEGLTMDNARLTGLDDDNQYYEVIADTATQTLTNPGVLDLEGITAQISGNGASWANLDAASGVYDRDNEKLRLERDIRVRSSEGYDIRLETADIDLAGGTVVTEDPVQIDMLNGTVRARAMTIENKGDTLRFYDGVSLSFVPSRQVQPETDQPGD